MAVLGALQDFAFDALGRFNGHHFVHRPRTSWFRAKNLIFACIVLMMAYVLRRNEHFLIDRTDPFWDHIQTFKWWLLVHGTAGACAMLLAPLQFSDLLRSRFTKMHRIVGRIYIGAVFFLAPMSDYIQYLDEQHGFVRSMAIPMADVVLQLQESWRARP